ncbi:MAG: hypothetical protein ACC652_14160 [Acidimicrobiales bacterium]
MANEAETLSEGVVAEVKEIVELVKNYALQETVDPIKRAGSYVALGLLGTVFMVFGMLFFSLSALRGLQEASAFEDTWSFVPYTIVAVGLVVLAFIAKIAMTSGGSK